jgi:glycosyltransferase involved in cell wall biosynthesis
VKQIIQQIQNKRAVFITTKNLDYIRNTQEINLLKQHAASLTVIGSAAKSYPKRLLHVYKTLLLTDFKAYDVVFVGFAPQLVLPFFGWKFKNNLVIEDFFISLYDTLTDDRKKVSPGSIPGRFFKALDRKTLQKASYVISDTRAHGAYFSQEFGCPAEKIHTLYLEADTSIYYPRESGKAHVPGQTGAQGEAAAHEGKFRVLYFGSILPVQGVDVVLKAGALLAGTSVELEIIGPVPENEKVNADHMIYHKWLSQTELAEHIAEADLCLAGHFAPNIGKAKRTIPGKAYIYAAMNRPMILGDSPANHELFSETQDGIYFVEMGNPKALADLIKKIAD